MPDRQRKLPFFSRALEAFSQLSQSREKLLPRLLRWGGDRSTRIEVYNALVAISEPMLVRYDLATGVLGWLGEDGAFCLSNQRRLAADSNLSSSVLNRLIKRLASVGYVRRRIELVTGRENGERFIRTRVLIQFTDLFWRHMGLSLTHGLARKSARKRRARQIAEIQQRRISQTAALHNQRKQREKRASAQGQGYLPNAVLPSTTQQTEADLRQFTSLLIDLKLANPSLDAAAIRQMAEDITKKSRQ